MSFRSTGGQVLQWNDLWMKLDSIKLKEWHTGVTFHDYIQKHTHTHVEKKESRKKDGWEWGHSILVTRNLFSEKKWMNALGVFLHYRFIIEPSL